MYSAVGPIDNYTNVVCHTKWYTVCGYVHATQVLEWWGLTERKWILVGNSCTLIQK